MNGKQRSRTDSQLAARCAAVASLGAAVIHFGVTPMHWRDWLPSGLFFVSIAVFQLLWALIVWSRPASLVLVGGIVANVVSAGLWVVSRAVGAPFGPYAGQPEAVEAGGICVLLLQCYVVMGAGWAWLQRDRSEEVSSFSRGAVLLGVNTVMAGAVTVGMVTSLQGHHHHHGVAEAQGDHHTGHGAHMPGHHDADSASVPESAPSNPTTSPGPVESGRPVTDMSLTADHAHSSQQDGLQESVAPQRPTTIDAVDPGQSDEEVESDSDGHQHDHQD